jgi:hypothetical protein
LLPKLKRTNGAFSNNEGRDIKLPQISKLHAGWLAGWLSIQGALTDSTYRAVAGILVLEGQNTTFWNF